MLPRMWVRIARCESLFDKSAIPGTIEPFRVIDPKSHISLPVRGFRQGATKLGENNVTLKFVSN